MKHTLLIALLGATVTLAAPSISFADNGYKFKSDAVEHNKNRKHQKSQAYKDRRHVKKDQKRFVAKPPKPHRIIKQVKRDHDRVRNQNKNRSHNKKRLDNRQFVKNNHGHNNHKQKNRHNRRNDSSFSISWNVGDATISYGNDWNHGGYTSGHNKSYNKGHRKNRGKRIYSRIHKQANRIQRGINNGQLVKREARKLRREQRHIKQTMAHYKQDGRFNRYESQKLNNLLDVASGNIHRKSNNQLTRYSRHNDYYVQY